MVTNCIIVELTPPSRGLDSRGGGGVEGGSVEHASGKSSQSIHTSIESQGFYDKQNRKAEKVNFF